MEGRRCLVCGAAAGVGGVCVFPLPGTARMRSAWLSALHCDAQTSTVQASAWLAGNDQYGVCEKHFNQQDIKRGRKPSLKRKAVPWVPNASVTVKVMEGSESGFTNGIAPDSSWDEEEVEEVTEGGVSNAGGFLGESEEFLKECVCLVCGRDGRSCKLVGLLTQVSDGGGKAAVSGQLSRVLGRVKRELMCVSVMICLACEALVQEVTHMEEELRVKKQSIKDMFEATLHAHKERTSYDESSAIVCPPSETYTEVQSQDVEEGDIVMNKDESSNMSNDEKEMEGGRKTSRRRATAKKYCCPQCHEVYTSLALWVHHLSKHSDTDDVLTPGKAKPTASKVKKKVKPVSGSGGGGHACEECGSTFPCKQSLTSHAAAHQKSWDCSVCGRYLTTKARLKAHLFRFHGIGEEKNKEVSCQECGKCFGTKAGLRYHRNVVHRVGMEYACQHCDKVFHYHVPYRSHLLYAHGEKKVVCETCGEKFFTISKLNTHINAVHRSAQSWTCDQCQAKFTTHTAYRHHINVKHLKVHHTCTYCGTQFRKKSSLLLHLWKHSVFICHVCRQNFPSDEDLRSHVSSVHGRELGWRGRRKQGQGIAGQDKKQPQQQQQQQQMVVGVVSEETNLEKVTSTAATTTPSEEPLQQNEHVASIVINDLLMTAETYDNSSLQPFSLSACEKLPEKVTYGTGHDQLKMKTLTMMEASRELNTPQFGTIEVKSASPDHMEMAPGVSLINVQILGDMEISQTDTLVGDLKGTILDPEDPPHLSVAPELEGPHSLEATEDHLEVASLDATATMIQVPESLEETTGDLDLDPHHECPLPPIDDGTLGEQESATCLDESVEGKDADTTSLHKEMDGVEQVDLEPFPVALGGKGEVQCQYVMYISAPGGDSSPG